MSGKTIVFARIALVLFAIASCVAFSWTCSSWLSVAWGCIVLDMLGDVSAILFGVFGIWLGMFYNPNITDVLKGKSKQELERIARNIMADGERFSIVFRGMKTSAVVLVFAMMARTLQTPLTQMATSYHPMVRMLLRHFFFTLVWFAMLAQSYSVLMSIAPMYDAKSKMDKAKKDAETALSL